jgi:hypothetical protein
MVATIAGASKVDLQEGPAMGIGVTVLAGAESQPFPLDRRLTGPRSVAFLARDGLMQSRKRVARPGMIESGRRLKDILRVTAEAIVAELAQMRVLVTGGTLPAQTKERPVRVFQFDLGPGAGGDFGRNMTVLALLPQVLAGQGEAGLGQVVEFPTVQTNERESQSLMFFVTAPAIGFVGRPLVFTGVKTQTGVHSAPDLGVTFQTLQRA